MRIHLSYHLLTVVFACIFLSSCTVAVTSELLHDRRNIKEFTNVLQKNRQLVVAAIQSGPSGNRVTTPVWFKTSLDEILFNMELPYDRIKYAPLIEFIDSSWVPVPVRSLPAGCIDPHNITSRSTVGELVLEGSSLKPTYDRLLWIEPSKNQCSRIGLYSREFRASRIPIVILFAPFLIVGDIFLGIISIFH